MVRIIQTLAMLKQYFGHSQFRPGQETLIDALLSGQDAVGVMPTGAGKSICYQLPALMLPGLTLVISPLISLMKDQVAALSQAGIPGAYINSSLTAEQYREVFRRAEAGSYKIIYVAPERLTSPDFLRFAQGMDISFLAVDEAHCVSQWGQDFRPSYLKIAEFITSLPKRPRVAAFTATATALVKADIEKLLGLITPLRITTGFDRPNLFFEVVQPRSKKAYLQDFLSRRPGQSGIVYCATRKAVESVCDALRQMGIAATRYHAGLEDGERKQNQEDFVYDRAKVMVATNAFGMGIDKSNVSFVMHYNMPKNIESYYQEAGRAGRDGEKAHCVLLFSFSDIQTAKILINASEDNEALSENEQKALKQQALDQLEQMISYCKTTGCLRNTILRYFGENPPADCRNCGNCNSEITQQDITVEAQKILSAVARVENKYTSSLGLTLILRMLHGSKEQRIMQLGLDRLPTYGIMNTIDRKEIRDYMNHLIDEGYLFLSEDEYPVLRMTPQARQILFDGEHVLYTSRRETQASMIAAPRKKSKTTLADEVDSGLLAALKQLRTRLALEENVPAYIVFSNATLADMAAKQPLSVDEFLQVTGVGAVKAARYGQAFLDEIQSWIHKAEP